MTKVFSVFSKSSVYSGLRDLKSLAFSKKISKMLLGGIISGAIISPLCAGDFDDEVRAELTNIRMEYMKPANFYIRTTINNMFDDTSDFECVGGSRAAECRVDSYEIDNATLNKFRYTVDYQDTRVIDRFSGELEYSSPDRFNVFLPKKFVCADFTQVHSEKGETNGLVNEQFNCEIKAPYYDISFRIRSSSTSPLFKDKNVMSLLVGGTQFLNKISALASINDEDAFKEEINKIAKVLNRVNTNIYGIEFSIKKPKLPEKVYEYLFADNLSLDDNESIAEKRYTQATKTLYNAGVGYIYGTAMGYVIGNDTINDRTKEGLTSALSALRDSAMLDSNVNRVTIKLTNRTKEGFNAGRAFKVAAKKLNDFKNTAIKKENAGKAINVFDGDFLNRYTIEVGVYRLR